MKRTVDVEYLPRPSIKSKQNQVTFINLRPSWMDPIITYRKQGTLPPDNKEAHKVKLQSAKYWLSQKECYTKDPFLGVSPMCSSKQNIRLLI